MNTIYISDRLNSRDKLEIIDELKRARTPNEVLSAIQALVEGSTKASDEVIAALLKALSHHHPAVPPAAVNALVQLAPDTVEPLIDAFKKSVDQGVQAHIIQALARIGDPRSVAVFEEVIGTSIANHCQGNVRRVAARGLGRIGSLVKDPEIIDQTVEKLTWALLNPEDWALRYAAVVSLEEIGKAEFLPTLQAALTQESDNVVQVRLKSAIAQLSLDRRC
ncbi:MAG TPA: glycosyl transferase family 2 [Cyanobacteria bacterium UBA9273]|nr:glycosyl transferase family 2 [Cyanobacteria bacterium UBA9273]